MESKYSRMWLGSKQPRKQRKYRYNAPLHVRQKLVSAHLSETLRKETGRRAMGVRKGDEVTVMRGEFKKSSGKVTRVDTKALKIFIDGVKRKKITGKDVDVPIDPSNVKITKLYMDDKKRKVRK